VESSLTGILPIRDQVAARAKTWCSGYIIAVSLQAEDKMLKPYILYLKEGILPNDRKGYPRKFKARSYEKGT
jgi:hypothetical protein